MQSAFQKKLLETFKIEAEEHLLAISNILLKVEAHPAGEAVKQLAELLHREAHSLKGASRAVNLIDMETTCQTLEAVFAGWKRSGDKVDASDFDRLHQMINELQQKVDRLGAEEASEGGSETLDILSLLDKSSGHPSGETDGYEGQKKSPAVNVAGLMEDTKLIQTVRMPIAKLDSHLLKAEEMLIVKLLMQKYHHSMLQINETIRSWKNEWYKASKSTDATASGEFLVKGLNYLKTLESTVASLGSQFEIDGRQINSLVDNMLDDAKTMLLMPFSTLLDGFPAMVRNISREQGKNINLIIEGADVEIDKRILEDLKDPLIHLIRNSIDHGIEKPEYRHNKPEKGTIKIAITQLSGNEVEVTLSDDGKGIDIEAVKIAAIKSGILTREEARTIQDEAALALIYQSGLSTSPIITNVSGNGLGMTIVQDKIEKIGGHIQLHSQPGAGTQIVLTLPLALTTFKGALITVAGQLFIIPTSHLERIVRINTAHIKTVENRATILVDDKTLSLVRLQDLMGLSGEASAATDKKYVPVLIIQFGGNRAAFEVDDIQGVQEILVKKLNKPLVRVRYVSAATILDSGVTVPILSASDLIRSAMKDILPQQASMPNPASNESDQNTILLIEDSITTRTLLKNILEMAGYGVKTAVDGLDGWRVLNESDIALIVSDIEMPRMNGFELTSKIRNDKKYAELPIVLVTSCEKPEDREYGIDVGANAYIVKSSFDDSNFLSVIKRLI